MKHLDFTIDFETCSLSANAAVMQVAIVPWDRFSKDNPFIDGWDMFVEYVDLRTCVVDGFDFDTETVRWWSRQSDNAKESVTKGLPEPITTVLVSSLEYISTSVNHYQAESTCLWSQGMDVDIAILRNLCSKYREVCRRYGVNIDELMPHGAFRDCRTVILEAAAARCSVCDDTIVTEPEEILANPAKAYALYNPLPDKYARGSVAHDALYDAVRSSWNTWQALKWLRQS